MHDRPPRLPVDESARNKNDRPKDGSESAEIDWQKDKFLLNEKTALILIGSPVERFRYVRIRYTDGREELRFCNLAAKYTHVNLSGTERSAGTVVDGGTLYLDASKSAITLKWDSDGMSKDNYEERKQQSRELIQQVFVSAGFTPNESIFVSYENLPEDTLPW